eukprot:SAG31_NODE_19316_length_606_cov_0.905325_1_plen_31_part_01
MDANRALLRDFARAALPLLGTGINLFNLFN